VISDENGETIFTLESGNPLASWSVRRPLKDSAGGHLLTVRHYRSKVHEYVVEGQEGKDVCFLKSDMPASITRILARFPSPSDMVTVTLQAHDRSGITTTFDVDGVKFAELQVAENNDASFLGWRGLDRSVWKLEVASNVNVALVLAMAVCRIEVFHAWRR
jgi:hypothetical protein